MEDEDNWLLAWLCEPSPPVPASHDVAPAPAIPATVAQAVKDVPSSWSPLQPASTSTQRLVECPWEPDFVPMPGSHCPDRSADDLLPLERPPIVLGDVRPMQSCMPLRLGPGVHYRVLKHPRREGLIARKHSPLFVAEHCLEVIRRLTRNFKIGVAIEPYDRLEIYRQEGVNTLIVLYHAETGLEAAALESTLISQFQLDERCRNIARGGEGVGAMQGATWVYVAEGGAARPKDPCLADKDFRWSRKRKHL